MFDCAWANLFDSRTCEILSLECRKWIPLRQPTNSTKQLSKKRSKNIQESHLRRNPNCRLLKRTFRLSKNWNYDLAVFCAAWFASISHNLQFIRYWTMFGSCFCMIHSWAKVKFVRSAWMDIWCVLDVSTLCLLILVCEMRLLIVLTAESK